MVGVQGLIWSMTKDNIRRRRLLKYAALAGAGSIAGCNSPAGDDSGGSQTTTTPDDGFMSQASQMGFADNWRDRRLAPLDQWSIEQRTDFPSADNDSDPGRWKETDVVQAAPWEPPEGWDETAAANVDQLTYLNAGSLRYDPAMAATQALFEDRTGIDMEILPIPGNQARPKLRATLSAGESTPQIFVSTPMDLMWTTFVQNGYLQPVDPLYSDEEMWDIYPSWVQNAYTRNGQVWGGLMLTMGSLHHVHPHMLREQGVDSSTIDRIVQGNGTWDDLETCMAAFEGTDAYAWGYRAGSQSQLLQDYKEMFYQAGGQIVQDGRVVYDQEPARFALKKMIEWRNKGWVPESVINYTQGDLTDGFMNEDLAMVPVFGDLVPIAVEKYGTDSDKYQPAVPLKGGSDAPNPTRAGVNTPTSFCVNPHAPVEEKLAALLWLDMRASATIGWYEYAIEGNNPFTKSTFTQAQETNSVPHSNIRQEALQYAQVEFYPQQAALNNNLTSELQLALAGEKSAEQALSDAQSYADNILAQ